MGTRTDLKSSREENSDSVQRTADVLGELSVIDTFGASDISVTETRSDSRSRTVSRRISKTLTRRI